MALDFKNMKEQTNKATEIFQFVLSIPKRLVLLLIRIYQKLLSFDHAFWARPDVFRVCIYHPSCSEYTYQAIEKYGLLKGGWMGAKRVISCNPLSKGGFDPVK